MKKILKWFGWAFLLLVVLGLINQHVVDLRTVIGTKPAKTACAFCKKHFAGNFAATYEMDATSDLKHLQIWLHFFKNGIAVAEYFSPVGDGFVNIYLYQTADTVIELNPVAAFSTYPEVRLGRDRIRPFTLRKSLPAAMTLESEMSKGGSILNGRAERLSNIRLNRSPIDTETSDEAKLMLQLYGMTTGDFRPVGITKSGEYTSIHNVSDDSESIASADELISMMQRTKMVGVSFEVQQYNENVEAERAQTRGYGRGMLAGEKFVVIIPILTVLLLIVSFMGSDERFTNYFADPKRKIPGMSTFNVVNVTLSIGASAFFLWLVGSFGFRIVEFFNLSHGLGIVNFVIAILFICSLISTNDAAQRTIDWFGFPGKIRLGWLEAIFGYALGCIMVFKLVATMVDVRDVNILRANFIYLYLCILLVTLPRTLVRLIKSRRRVLTLLYYTICYPLQYPLFIIVLLVKVVEMMLNNPFKHEPETIEIMDEYGHRITLTDTGAGKYTGTDGRSWVRSGPGFKRIEY